jgi:Gryzun, putative Golgi trafficking
VLNLKQESIKLRYEIDNSSDFFINGFSKRKIELKGGEEPVIEVNVIPLKTGLLKLPVLKVTDVASKQIISNSTN